MGLQENARSEPVSRFVLREPVTISPESTVRDAVLRMRERNLGCAIVVDEDQKPVGMFTESMLTKLLDRDPSRANEPIGTHIAESTRNACTENQPHILAWRDPRGV